MEATNVASEGGHFYTYDGQPAYTVPNKSKPGTFRATTVRDAKALSLLPSVTTILKVMARPGLEIWKTQQVLLSSLTLPMIDGETLEQYAERIMIDSREQSRNACDRGKLLHGEIEKYFTGKPVLAEHIKKCVKVDKKLREEFGVQDWRSEKSFAWPELGYGGKTDLHSDEWVVDFKTKDFGHDNLPKIYDEHAQQLAAYRNGLGVPDAQCAIVFVSTTADLVHIVRIDEEKIERGWKMFKHALGYWQELKNYKPEVK
jgi:hypothetical protein